jgi:putative oxidoreductase
MAKLVAFVGRLLFVSLFLMAGLNHITQFDKEVDFVASQLAQLNVPAITENARYVFGITIGLQIVGSLLVLLNQKIGYLLLLAFLVPTTYLVHDFWNLPSNDPALITELQAFLHNVSLAGAAVALYASSHTVGILKTTSPAPVKAKRQ